MFLLVVNRCVINNLLSYIIIFIINQVNDEWVSGRLHEEPEEYDYSDLLESTTTTEPLLDIF